SAYFEIYGGTLKAYPFPPPTAKPPLGYYEGGSVNNDPTCYRFAQLVEYYGNTQSAALLQILSDRTLGDWETITLNNTGPVYVVFSNMTPAERKGTAVFSSHHFVLNEKILAVGSPLPMITGCNNPQACVSQSPPF